MKTYQNVKITAYLNTPIAINFPLHLDAVLTAVHPSMHNKNAPSRFAATNSKIENAPLPLMSARTVRKDGSYSWVWVATASEFPSNAKMSIDGLTRRLTPSDIESMQRTIQSTAGAMRNLFERFTVILTDRVFFYASTDNVKELRRIITRAKHVGRLRKNGYGSVKEWVIENDTERDFKNYLCKNSIARRRLPDDFCMDMSTKKLNIRPPYWHDCFLANAYEVGDTATLKGDIFITKRGEKFELQSNSER